MTPTRLADIATAAASKNARNARSLLTSAEAARQALGVARLPWGIGDVVAAAVAKVEARRRLAVIGSTKIPAPIAIRLERKLQELATPIVEGWVVPPATGRGGTGGRIFATVRRAGKSAIVPGKVFAVDARGAAAKNWHKNGKWSANDVEVEIGLGRHWIRDVYRRDLAVVDGILTLDLAQAGAGLAVDGAEVLAGTFARHGRGFALVVEGGALVVDGLGPITHLTSKELEAIREGGKPAARVEKRIAKARADRAARAVAACGELVAFLDLHPQVDTSAVVTLRDSVAAGNCRVGTADWIARHFPGRKSATLGELLEAAYRTGDRARFVERIALHMAHRGLTVAA